MRKKLIIEFSDQDYCRLLDLAHGTSLSDLFRKALNTDAYFQECEARGDKILIETPDGKVRELVRL